MRKLSRFRIPQLKKQSIVVGGLLLGVIFIGVYILWSKQVWDDYQPDYTQWHQNVKSGIDKAVTLPTVSVEERTTALVALKKVTLQIMSKDKVCVVHPLMQWQQKIITELNEAQIACQKEANKTMRFKALLDKVIAYIEDDQELAAILAEVPQPDEIADGDWEKQVAIWDGAIKLTEKLSISDDFKPVQQLAISQMTKIKVAWQGVLAAHQAKDKAGYLAAQDALASAIDELDAIATTGQKTVSDLSRQLEAASDATFN